MYCVMYTRKGKSEICAGEVFLSLKEAEAFAETMRAMFPSNGYSACLLQPIEVAA